MQGRIIRILSLIKKEFLSIFKDPKSRALIITPPILQLFVFAKAKTKNRLFGVPLFAPVLSYASNKLLCNFPYNPCCVFF
jgi:ABC-2 type transport system permease protein